MRPLVLSLQQFSVHWEPNETISEACRMGSILIAGLETGRLGRSRRRFVFASTVACVRYLASAELRSSAIDTDSVGERQTKIPAILPDGQISSKSVQPFAKNFPLNPSGKSTVKSMPSCPERGALAIVTNVGTGRGGRGSVARASDVHRAMFVSERERARRAMLLRTAKPCGPGTRCWCQVGGGEVSPTGFDQPLIRQRR